MVNPQIISYLAGGVAKGFNLNALKQNLISKGYNPREVEDAAAQLMNQSRARQNSMPISFRPSNTNQPIQYNNQGKTRWMKIGGIAGIILSILFIVSLITSTIISIKQTQEFEQQYQNNLNQFNSQDFNYTENPDALNSITQQSQSTLAYGIITIVFTILLGIAFFVLSLLYFKGFINAGRAVGSRLLTFAAKSIMSIIISFGVIAVILISYLTYLLASSITENQTLFQPLIENFQIVLIILGLVVLFSFISGVLFSSALIQARNKLKFSLSSGICYLISATYYALQFIVTAILIYTLISAFSGLTSGADLGLGNNQFGATGNNQFPTIGGDPFANISGAPSSAPGLSPTSGSLLTSLASILANPYLAYTMMATSFIAMLLASLALLDASKKYEQ